MKKNKLANIFAACIWLFGVQISYCQTVTGRVTNRQNHAVGLATVSLLKESALLSITVTDSLGKFTLNHVPQGTIKIQTSFIGYATNETVFYFNRDTTVNVQLAASSENLKAVTVTGKKPVFERKIDRLVFNVANSPAVAGLDAMGSISKIPGVLVNNNSISLVGKSTVNVLIDDVVVHLSGDDLANYLRTIPAEDIERIELITNPPAQYDAGGNSGLINIVKKRNTKLGYNGNIWTGFNQRTYNDQFLGGIFTYKKKNVGVQLNFNTYSESKAAQEGSTIYYPAQTWETVSNRHDKSNPFINWSIGTAFDFILSKKDHLNISYSFNKPSVELSAVTTTKIIDKATGKLDSILLTTSPYYYPHQYNSADIQYFHAFDNKGKNIKILADGFWNLTSYHNRRQDETMDANGMVNPSSVANYTNNSMQNGYNYSVQADVNLPNKFFYLQTGAKASFSNIQSNNFQYRLINSQSIPDSSNTSIFNYTENVQSLYFNAGKQVKKWQFQLGLRGEYTQTKGNAVLLNQIHDTGYFKIFPTVYIQYNLNGRNALNLNYGKRINRASYWDLTPYKRYYSQYYYGEGNPFLQPGFMNNFELSYTYNNMLTSSLSFSYMTNGYENVTFSELNNIQHSYPLNFKTTYQYAWTVNYIFNKLKWLESSNSIITYYSKTVSSLAATLPVVEGWGAYFSTYNQLYFNSKKTVSATVQFVYSTPHKNGITGYANLYYVNTGLQFSLLHRKIEIAVNGDDIFKTNISNEETFVDGLKKTNFSYYDVRRLGLTIRYKFGNNKIQQQQQHASNNEEKSRMQ